MAQTAHKGINNGSNYTVDVVAPERLGNCITEIGNFINPSFLFFQQSFRQYDQPHNHPNQFVIKSMLHCLVGMQANQKNHIQQELKMLA